MGGYGSGRYGGRPTADASLRIDLAWMIRTGLAREGSIKRGSINWTCGDRPSGSIGYTAYMDEPGCERLDLSYQRGPDDKREDVRQTIHLCHTAPHYGGKRWWMLWPYRGIRVGKLYLPPGGDRFASRQAWRLGYRSQREARHDRAFTRLNRLQKKLGSKQGWEAGLFRPKGMWHRTYERHLDRYWALDEACNLEMVRTVSRINARLGRGES